MRPEEQEVHDQVAILRNAGFDTGWALRDGELVLWEHDAEPPAPFTRPVAEKTAKTAK